MLLPPVNVFADAVEVEVDDGLSTFVRLKEFQRESIVHESIFREDGGAVGVAENVERGFEVGVTVGVVRADVMAGKMAFCCFVQVGGQSVGFGVAGEGEGAPAGCVHPFVAHAGGVDVDGDYEGVVRTA